jgi:glucosylceramidase
MLILFVFTACKNEIKQEGKSIPLAYDLTGKSIEVFVTAQGTDKRIANAGALTFAEHGQPVEVQNCVFVDPTRTFQSFVGIGGAITDASAETFAKLPEAQQQELLTAYYDSEKGIGYTLARTHINSCDFSSASYTYVTDGDTDLKSFDISHDKQFRIPLIKKAIATAGGTLPLYVSPWSPPAWMKDNNNMLRGGKLKPEYYQSWANYYVKFINEYEKEGMPIWGLTVQNEPMAVQTWESCIYTAEEERDFVKNYLGPTLANNNLGDRKLIVWDHNRDLMYQRAQTMFNDPEASKYVWGMGFHWYEDWKGGDNMFGNVAKVHEAWPDINLIFTEGCGFPFKYENIISDWSLGERYGRNMINDFNSGTVAWTDWNILLDETGGPNHVQNFCFAPVHADTRTGTLLYSNAYYYIGHFSKFIRPGAKRVQTSTSYSNLLTTAFENKDGSLVIVVMNGTEKNVPFYLWINNKSAQTESLAHSISTFIVR